MLAVPESSEDYQRAQEKSREYEANLVYAKRTSGLTPMPYKVIDSGGNNVMGRKRIEVRIVAPEAETFEQRGETVILAARELQASENADVVRVILEASEALPLGKVLAIADYAPDGGGYSGDQGWTWEVTASSDPVTSQRVEIAKAWEARKNSFLVKDDYGEMVVDIHALSAALANEFGVSQDEALPLIITSMDDYPSPE